MRIIRGQHNLERHRVTAGPGAVTIGNFDGVHLGHQAVLSQLRRLAGPARLTTRVVIFEPQPNEYFAQGTPPARLTRLAEKLRLLHLTGVDEAVVLRFDAGFAQTTAEEFVDRVLVRGLHVAALVIGDDFRFGRGRSGDFEALCAAGSKFGFSVTQADTFEISGRRVSSTRVREALAGFGFAEVRRLLGRPYRIRGRVVHGRKQGRTIGFPTANIHLGRQRVPLAGIFAVRVFGIGAGAISGSAYIGSRPVIEDNETVLEVHLLDFSGDLYGRNLEVEFVAFVRGDLPFASMEALKVQIARDNAEVRRLLEVNRRTTPAEGG